MQENTTSHRSSRRDRETRNAKRGKPARIIAKVNALVDPPIIQALYRASQAGVEIDLIVRGQCALVPGLRSIVGRFLEHSRIFYFENGGEPEIYLGSADWMQRNLYERVEVLFPLNDPALKQRITGEVLAAYLEDTRTARVLGPDGKFTCPRHVRNGHGVSVQEKLMRAAQFPASHTGKRPAKNVNGALPTVVPEPGSAKPEPDEGADSMSHDTFSAAV